MTSRPRRGVLAPGRHRWLRDAPAQDRRTAIVRIGASTDPRQAARHPRFGVGRLDARALLDWEA